MVQFDLDADCSGVVKSLRNSVSSFLYGELWRKLTGREKVKQSNNVVQCTNYTAVVFTSRRHRHTEIITADAGTPSSYYRGKCRYSAPSGDQRMDLWGVGTFRWQESKPRPRLSRRILRMRIYINYQLR